MPYLYNVLHVKLVFFFPKGFANGVAQAAFAVIVEIKGYIWDKYESYSQYPGAIIGFLQLQSDFSNSDLKFSRVMETVTKTELHHLKEAN